MARRTRYGGMKGRPGMLDGDPKDGTYRMALTAPGWPRVKGELHAHRHGVCLEPWRYAKGLPQAEVDAPLYRLDWPEVQRLYEDLRQLIAKRREFLKASKPTPVPRGRSSTPRAKRET